MQINKYYLAALSSFIIWGFFSLALKPLHDYPSLDILFYRVFLATVLLLIINLIFRKKIIKNDLQILKNSQTNQKFKAIFLTAFGGLLLILNWFLFIYAVNHVSLKSASFAYLICPIITTILAFFILKEKLSSWQWFSVFLCILSCAILSFGHLSDLFYSLTIAVSFALYLISQKNNKFDRFVVLTVQMVIASIIILPFFPFYSGQIPSEPIFYILLIVIVIVFTIIPLFLNLFALKGINSSTVGILMYTNPLINFVLAIFYFKEEINQMQIIAYTLILISVIIFNERFFFKKK
ncbi:EamA family transporter [Flavobacterium sp.]|uniref:EamA family transporter n=1 Tax=Flavobacterium sp. TaxID=239 RepID=UPI00286C8C62|nr:EamA family transporter [Flavobacterium sp.]